MATEESEQIGDRIRRRRDYLGWTQRELSRRAKVTSSTIVRLEQGDRLHVTLEVAGRIARALGVSLDYLNDGYEPPA